MFILSCNLIHSNNIHCEKHKNWIKCVGGWVGKHNVQKGTFIEIKRIIYVNSCEKSKQWHSVEICRGNEKMYTAHFLCINISLITDSAHLQIVSHKFLFSRNFELHIILVKQLFIFMVSPRNGIKLKICSKLSLNLVSTS